MKLLNTINLGFITLKDELLFQRIVTEVLAECEIEDIVLANDLSVSRSTVRRWKKGIQAPFPSMRASVYDVLKKYVRNKPKISLFEDDESYTSVASHLSSEVNKLLKPLVENLLDRGYKWRDILAVIETAAGLTVLTKQNIYER